MSFSAASAFRFQLGETRSFGTSDVARFLRRAWDGTIARLHVSNALGNPSLLDELYQLAEECSAIGWDGYDAVAISRDTVRVARDFIMAIPSNMKFPAIAAEPDGHVTLEWYASPKRVLSVSVSPQALIHYAALLGSASQNGTEPFLGEFPESILELVKRVTQE